MKGTLKHILLTLIVLAISFVGISCDMFGSKKYNLYFFLEDEGLYKTVQTSGKEIIKFADPTKEGYIFEGWFFDKGTWENEFKPTTYANSTLGKDMLIYGHFSKIDSIKDMGLELLDFTKEDIGDETIYTYDVSSTVKNIDFKDFVEINSDYTWTLSSDEAGLDIIENSVLNINNSTTIAYIQISGNQKHTYKVVISQSSSFTVRFDSDGGTEVNSQIVPDGGLITMQPQTTKEGYSFVKWDYDFTKPVTSNITIKAIWEKDTVYYIVKFNTNGGTVISDKRVEEGTTISAPTVTKNGYVLESWDYDFTKPITSNITITCTWEVSKEVLIKYVDSYTNALLYSHKETLGTTISLYTPTSSNNDFTFFGWMLNGEYVDQTSYYVTGAVTLSAVWTYKGQSFENGSNPFISYRNATQQGAGHTLSISSDASSDGNKSLKVTTINHDLGSLALSKEYLYKIFSNDNIKAISFDIYASALVNENEGLDIRLHDKEATPTATYRVYPMYKTATKGTWTTYTYPLEYFKSYLSNNPSSQYVKIFFNRYEDVFYVDNIKPVYEYDNYVAEHTTYIENQNGFQTYTVSRKPNAVFLNGTVLTDYTYDNLMVKINNSYFSTDGDYELIIICGDCATRYAVDVINLTNTATYNVTTSYGTSDYSEFPVSNVYQLVSPIGNLPFENSSGKVIIPNASLVECLETVNNKKVSGSFKVYALSISGSHTLVTVNVTLTNNDNVKGTNVYNGKTDYDYMSYQSIPTVADYKYNLNNISYEFLEEQAQSGITVLQPGADACFSIAEDTPNLKMVTLMERASELGLKMIVADYLLINLTSVEGGVVGSGKTYATTQELDAAIWARMQTYITYDSFYGVVLRDEPKLSFLQSYKDVCDSIKRLCAAHNFECFIYYNLLPMFASPEYYSETSNKLTDRIAYYKNYVLSFINAVGNKQVTFDIYPLRNSGVSKWWILNMIILANICKENDCQFNFTTQSCTYYSTGGTVNDRVLDMEDLRYINNFMLGYGVKNVQFYVYCARTSMSSIEIYLDEGSFFSGDASVKNPMYYYWKALIEEDIVFNNIIDEFDYVASNITDKKNDKLWSNTSSKTYMTNKTETYYHSDYAENNDDDTMYGNLSSVYVDKEYVLVNTLHNDRTNEYMYMIQNLVDPQYESFQTITVTFNNCTYLEVYENGSRRVVYLNNNQATIKLAQGNAVFIIAH